LILAAAEHLANVPGHYLDAGDPLVFKRDLVAVRTLEIVQVIAFNEDAGIHDDVISTRDVPSP
jgi:hypothetical protein